MSRIARFTVAVVVAIAVATPVSSQAPTQPSRSIRQKSPYLAGGLSLVTPGSGHVYVGSWKRGLLWFTAAAASWYSVLLTDEDYAWNSMYLVYGLTALDATTDALSYNRDARRKAGLALNLTPPMRAETRTSRPRVDIPLVRLTF